MCIQGGSLGIGKGGKNGAAAPGGRFQGVAKYMFQEKEIDFMRLYIFKLMGQVTGNSVTFIF